MATSMLFKFLTLKWNTSRTIWRIEVGDGSLFCIFHALSFELNFFFDRRFPLTEIVRSQLGLLLIQFQGFGVTKLGGREKKENAFPDLHQANQSINSKIYKINMFNILPNQNIQTGRKHPSEMRKMPPLQQKGEREKTSR